MLKIGDFAQLGGITIKSLHYYDREGLLRPEYTDPATGYRYYSIEQLPRLNRILALKDLGFTLQQIRLLLQNPLTAPALRSMLTAKRQAIQELVQQEEARLTRIEARLQQIEQEEALLSFDIVMKEMEPQTMLSIRETVAHAAEIQRCCRELAGRIAEQALAQGLPLSGPWTTLYYNGPYTPDDCNIDIEMGLIVDRKLPCLAFTDRRIAVRRLEMGRVVSLIHTGAYETIWQAHFAMIDWADSNGYTHPGLFRITMLRMSSEGNPITEVQLAIQ